MANQSDTPMQSNTPLSSEQNKLLAEHKEKFDMLVSLVNESKILSNKKNITIEDNNKLLEITENKRVLLISLIYLRDVF